MKAEALAIAAALLLFAPIARADDEIDAATLRAEKLADDAHARADRGAWSEAVELYLEASRAAPAAVLLYDVARIYDEHLGSPQLALEYYRRTVASPDVEPEIAARAKARIAALEPRTEKQTPLPKEEPKATRTTHPLRPWAVVVGGAGVVALGVGAAFAVVAKNKDSEASQYCSGAACTDPRALTLTDDATSAARVADVAVGVGLVLVAGGVAMWILGPKKPVPALAPRSLVLGGTW